MPDEFALEVALAVFSAVFFLAAIVLVCWEVTHAETLDRYDERGYSDRELRNKQEREAAPGCVPRPGGSHRWGRTVRRPRGARSTTGSVPDMGFTLRDQWIHEPLEHRIAQSRADAQDDHAEELAMGAGAGEHPPSLTSA